MDRIPVKLKTNPYDIIVGSGILTQVPSYLSKLGLGKDAVIVTHPSLARLYGKTLKLALMKAGYGVDIITVPEGERSKSAVCALAVIEKIAKIDVNKKIFCIALGGGVVGDLTGFVAAIYKRGVPYIQVPTSLLAQVDSAIGGKTAIDLKVGKNLVGAFYQPKLVVMDTALLKTLSQRQLRNGLAEVIKYGIIADKKLFAYIDENLLKFLKHDKVVLGHLVASSARIKARVVAEDEFETKGIRTILNFGHTAGHAVEAAAGFDRYQHGESVALGMRVAARISVLLGYLSTREEAAINNVITQAGLPINIQHVSLPAIWKHMRHDKKFIAGENRFVLATGIGTVNVTRGIEPAVINQAIKAYLR